MSCLEKIHDTTPKVLVSVEDSPLFRTASSFWSPDVLEVRSASLPTAMGTDNDCVDVPVSGWNVVRNKQVLASLVVLQNLDQEQHMEWKTLKADDS